jgi:hypothetical protein
MDVLGRSTLLFNVELGSEGPGIERVGDQSI